MIRQLVMILVYLCEGRSQFEEVPSILKRLPNFIHELCPEVSICPSNNSARDQTSEKDLGTCCTECSCNSDCLKHGDCCFPKMLQQSPDLNASYIDFQNERSCLYPVVPQPARAEEEIQYQSFSMISSAVHDLPDGSKKVLNRSCGDSLVASWGSLYPVYSAKSKQIYKNMHCAKENGISDGVLWQAVMNCQLDRVLEAINGLESRTIPDSCEIIFIYSGDLNDLKMSKCYTSLIETCPESPEFQLPVWTNLSKNDIITLCTSGFMSPYQRVNKYANVFCHICNAEYFSHLLFCDKTSPNSIKGIKAKGFTALIDGDFIATLSNNFIVKENSLPSACSPHDIHICRHVLCPSGQLRNKNGRCFYPNKLWLNQNYGIYINCTAEQQINLSDMFNVSSGEISFVSPQLKSPWGKVWAVTAIFYKETGTELVSNNLIIFVSAKLQMVKPSNIIRYVKRMVDQPWSFVQNNESVVLKSSNFALITVFPTIFDSDIGNSPVKPRHKLIYLKSTNYKFNQHIITQMYVCDQVELNETEFILSQDNSTLYYYTNQRYFFDGEFTIIKRNSFGEIRARICIEDSGLQIMEVKSIGTPFKGSGDFIAVFVLCLETTYINYNS